MIVTLLKDLETDKVDVVIISEKTTTEEIQSIINDVKEKYTYTYTFDLIRKKLPNDCKVFSSWEQNIGAVWY